MSALSVGDAAPGFCLPAVLASDSANFYLADGVLPAFSAQNEAFGVAEVCLSTLLAKATKGVIVYFYPRASTPGCTRQACDFRDSFGALRAAGYLVVGVSPDKTASLSRFAANHGIPFPFLSDVDKNVLENWGAWGEKKNYGRVFKGVIRSTVVVNPNGTVVLADYGVRATGHVALLSQKLGVVTQQ